MSCNDRKQDVPKPPVKAASEGADADKSTGSMEKTPGSNDDSSSNSEMTWFMENEPLSSVERIARCVKNETEVCSSLSKTNEHSNIGNSRAFSNDDLGNRNVCEKPHHGNASSLAHRCASTFSRGSSHGYLFCGPSARNPVERNVQQSECDQSQRGNSWRWSLKVSADERETTEGLHYHGDPPQAENKSLSWRTAGESVSKVSGKELLHAVNTSLLNCKVSPSKCSAEVAAFPFPSRKDLRETSGSRPRDSQTCAGDNADLTYSLNFVPFPRTAAQREHPGVPPVNDTDSPATNTAESTPWGMNRYWNASASVAEKKHLGRGRLRRDGSSTTEVFNSFSLLSSEASPNPCFTRRMTVPTSQDSPAVKENCSDRRVPPSRNLAPQLEDRALDPQWAQRVGGNTSSNCANKKSFSNSTSNVTGFSSLKSALLPNLRSQLEHNQVGFQENKHLPLEELALGQNPDDSAQLEPLLVGRLQRSSQGDLSRPSNRMYDMDGWLKSKLSGQDRPRFASSGDLNSSLRYSSFGVSARSQAATSTPNCQQGIHGSCPSEPRDASTWDFALRNRGAPISGSSVQSPVLELGSRRRQAFVSGDMLSSEPVLGSRTPSHHSAPLPPWLQGCPRGPQVGTSPTFRGRNLRSGLSHKCGSPCGKWTPAVQRPAQGSRGHRCGQGTYSTSVSTSESPTTTQGERPVTLNSRRKKKDRLYFRSTQFPLSDSDSGLDNLVPRLSFASYRAGKLGRGNKPGSKSQDGKDNDRSGHDLHAHAVASPTVNLEGQSSASAKEGGRRRRRAKKGRGGTGDQSTGDGGSKTGLNTNNSALPGADVEPATSDVAKGDHGKKKEKQQQQQLQPGQLPQSNPQAPQQQQQQQQQHPQWQHPQQPMLVPMYPHQLQPHQSRMLQQTQWSGNMSLQQQQQQQHPSAWTSPGASAVRPPSLFSLASGHLDPMVVRTMTTQGPSNMVTARASPNAGVLGVSVTPMVAGGGGQRKRNLTKLPGQGQGQSPGQGQGQNQGKKTHHQRRPHHHKGKHFEDYLPIEEVSAKLKRGEIFQGVIRINPRNFEDAYVPLPDGTADVYIPGVRNRNRALNGDVVAIQLFERHAWRVYKDDLELYEAEEEANVSTLDQNMDGSDSNDSGPDVVIESVEVINDGVDTRSVDSRDTDSLSANFQACAVASPGTDSSRSKSPDASSNLSESCLGDGAQTDDATLRPGAEASSRKGPPTKQGPSGRAFNKEGEGRGGKEDGASNRQQVANQHKYLSLGDVVSSGSPVVKELFHLDPGHPDHAERKAKSDRFLQVTGKVVAIVERKSSRACSGSLHPLKDGNKEKALFSPLDHRLPRLFIPMEQCPKGFCERPNDFANHLYIARIVDWPNSGQFAKGQLARSLGEAGEIEPETEAILVENDVDYSEFSNECLRNLPSDLPWSIPEEEFAKRRDFRQNCVFTIDPATARDLDDALSIDVLPDGLFEVGVHIADVSYFVHEKTNLNKVASERATSVYLVQKVIPMLPRLLCEQLCSLNPDEDRLTFSVVWKMDAEANILEEWFGRSIIRSCAKLSYDHAQGFIDEPKKTWTRDELPPISNSFDVEDIKSRTLLLYKLSKKLRKGRFDSGALRLDQVKLQYTLDSSTGLPNGYFVYQQRASNKLVEEFMLLANMAVAAKIHSSFPDKALLRRHPPPQNKMLDDLESLTQELGVPLDTSSAGALQATLVRHAGNDEFKLARMQILVAMCSKPMQNAKYFCTGVLQNETLYHHYALNVPRYTHFTSPIRRFPDILVHRLLSAALGYGDEPDLTPEQMELQAEHCNEKKLSAKRVSELSNDLYFSVFVKMAGPLEEKAMVMGVMDRSFDIFVLKLGVVKRVYCNALTLKSFEMQREKRKVSMKMVWPETETEPELEQTVSIFSVVECILETDPKATLKWNALIKRPRIT